MGEAALHGADARIALGRIGLERALDDVDEAFRQVRPQVVQALALAAIVHPPQLGQRPRDVGIRAGDEVEQEDAEAVDVALRRGVGAGEHFRREVERRAGDRRGLHGFVVLEQQAGAEVHQHEPAALFADDVLRLDVAMDEAGGVDRGQRPAQILAEQRRFAPAERALSLQQLFEGVAADELHPQADAAVVGVDAVHGDDVAVADAGQEAAFVQHLGGEQLGGPPARPAGA